MAQPIHRQRRGEEDACFSHVDPVAQTTTDPCSAGFLTWFFNTVLVIKLAEADGGSNLLNRGPRRDTSANTLHHMSPKKRRGPVV